MRIECPSCNFSAEVSKEKVPPMGGDTKCPRCSTVFFVTPAELVMPAPPSARTNCPKCGCVQGPSETCANCGLIYAKHRIAVHSVTKVAPLVEKQGIGQETLQSSNQTRPFDIFQGVLLACGVFATIYGLKRGIDLMAMEEKFRGKYLLIPSKMGFLNRVYSCVLPSIGIAEFILLILIVYGYAKSHNFIGSIFISFIFILTLTLIAYFQIIFRSSYLESKPPMKTFIAIALSILSSFASSYVGVFWAISAYGL